MNKMRLLTALPVVACGLALASCGPTTYDPAAVAQNVCDIYNEGMTEEQIAEMGWTVTEYNDDGSVKTQGSFVYNTERDVLVINVSVSSTTDGIKDVLKQLFDNTFGKVKNVKVASEWEESTSGWLKELTLGNLSLIGVVMVSGTSTVMSGQIWQYSAVHPSN